ncbi:LysR substrate-binding domain-containing protein [Mesorhizobium sp. YC-39]|uniref:LysR substrate-binding domain-containing protein n=1 Tax=unclassified Mesorhizobium TaxID=325217 RepID=UPI0021E71BC9|nr:MULTISPECIES: LysR substrate-binding domain-containing protein [unclassified Mesorhizobium]MCV3206994.1 LysR substrate-binding domain-containing protein [Mesorhizobium sp. YC-2]MCV3228720.1 LysR substrate-binding domain-containing protein [Mesorhizobium sp. YC-39]
MTTLRDLPLSALRALAAAARTGSLTRAANELGVTPGAVGHQLRQLEDGLGVKLVRRAGNGIVLTRAAENALPDIDRGFDALASGMRRLRFERQAETFTICADPSFASLWLAPRLDRVRTALAGLDVRIVASIALDVMLEEGVDLAISYRKATAQDLASVDLFTERVIPACAPALVQGIARPDAATVLDRLPLLHIDPTMGDDVYPAWRHWFAAAGRQPKGIDQGPRFGLTIVAAQAAIAGMGALLASELVLRRHLEPGHLIEIARDVPALTIRRRLVWPLHGPKARRAAAIATELAATVGLMIDGALPQ